MASVESAAYGNGRPYFSVRTRGGAVTTVRRLGNGEVYEDTRSMDELGRAKFIKDNFGLVAKVLSLPGIAQYRADSAGPGEDDGSKKLDALRREYVKNTDEIFAEALESAHPAVRAVIRHRLANWQAFPPDSTSFSTEERGIITRATEGVYPASYLAAWAREELAAMPQPRTLVAMGLGELATMEPDHIVVPYA